MLLYPSHEVSFVFFPFFSLEFVVSWTAAGKNRRRNTHYSACAATLMATWHCKYCKVVIIPIKVIFIHWARLCTNLWWTPSPARTTLKLTCFVSWSSTITCYMGKRGWNMTCVWAMHPRNVAVLWAEALCTWGAAPLAGDEALLRPYERACRVSQWCHVRAVHRRRSVAGG